MRRIAFPSFVSQEDDGFVSTQQGLQKLALPKAYVGASLALDAKVDGDDSYERSQSLVPPPQLKKVRFSALPNSSSKDFDGSSSTETDSSKYVSTQPIQLPPALRVITLSEPSQPSLGGCAEEQCLENSVVTEKSLQVTSQGKKLESQSNASPDLLLAKASQLEKAFAAVPVVVSPILEKAPRRKRIVLSQSESEPDMAVPPTQYPTLAVEPSCIYDYDDAANYYEEVASSYVEGLVEVPLLESQAPIECSSEKDAPQVKFELSNVLAKRTTTVKPKAMAERSRSSAATLSRQSSGKNRFDMSKVTEMRLRSIHADVESSQDEFAENEPIREVLSEVLKRTPDALTKAPGPGITQVGPKQSSKKKAAKPIRQLSMLTFVSKNKSAGEAEDKWLPRLPKGN